MDRLVLWIKTSGVLDTEVDIFSPSAQGGRELSVGWLETFHRIARVGDK